MRLRGVAAADVDVCRADGGVRLCHRRLEQSVKQVGAKQGECDSGDEKQDQDEECPQQSFPGTSGDGWLGCVEQGHLQLTTKAEYAAMIQPGTLAGVLVQQRGALCGFVQVVPTAVEVVNSAV